MTIKENFETNDNRNAILECKLDGRNAGAAGKALLMQVKTRVQILRVHIRSQVGTISTCDPRVQEMRQNYSGMPAEPRCELWIH